MTKTYKIKAKILVEYEDHVWLPDDFTEKPIDVFSKNLAGILDCYFYGYSLEILPETEIIEANETF